MPATYRTDYQPTLLATVVAIKVTAGKLYGLEASNPNTVSIWLQFFDLATGDVTIGTTTPKMTLVVPKGASASDVGAMDKLWTAGIHFETAIVVAATTTPTGSTAPGTGLDVNSFFR